MTNRIFNLVCLFLNIIAGIVLPKQRRSCDHISSKPPNKVVVHAKEKQELILVTFCCSVL